MNIVRVFVVFGVNSTSRAREQMKMCYPQGLHREKELQFNASDILIMIYIKYVFNMPSQDLTLTPHEYKDLHTAFGFSISRFNLAILYFMYDILSFSVVFNIVHVLQCKTNEDGQTSFYPKDIGMCNVVNVSLMRRNPDISCKRFL